MKRLILLVGFVALATTPAAAQKAQNIEFGGFGSWWRFDRSFFIANGFGGGVRIGYNFSDKIGVEITGDYIATTNLAATQDIKCPRSVAPWS
jgi:opacity protein-like surface antigen